MLNADVNHALARYPAKVFVIERIISFLIATNEKWSVKTYTPWQFPFANRRLNNFKRELIQLDALKMAYCDTGLTGYIQEFDKLRHKTFSTNCDKVT